MAPKRRPRRRRQRPARKPARKRGKVRKVIIFRGADIEGGKLRVAKFRARELSIDEFRAAKKRKRIRGMPPERPPREEREEIDELELTETERQLVSRWLMGMTLDTIRRAPTLAFQRWSGGKPVGKQKRLLRKLEAKFTGAQTEV